MLTLLAGIVNVVVVALAFVNVTEPLVTVHPPNLYPEFAVAVIVTVEPTICVHPPVVVPPAVGLFANVTV